MTIDVVGAPTERAWVGALVLCVAPRELMARVADAVARAEATVLGDPVLGDMARVATTTTSDPLARGIDDITLTLHRELIDWALSPVRNPAQWVTFSLLVVHSDAVAAERLVRQLAAANVLSELPIVFRVGALPAEADESVTDASGQITRMVLDAVDATAREIEQVEGFAIPVTRLRELSARAAPPPRDLSAVARVPEVLEPAPGPAPLPVAAGGRRAAPLPRPPALSASPQPTPRPRHATPPAATIAQPDGDLHPEPAREPSRTVQSAPTTQPVPASPGDRHRETTPATPPAPSEWAASTAGAEPVMANPVLASPSQSPAAPAPDEESVTSAQRVSDELRDLETTGSRGLGALLGSAMARLTERRAPSSSVEVIDDLSRRGDTVALLYLILVSEPVPPPRRNRSRRAAVAVELARAAMSDTHPWYVRAFSADQHLRPAGPLPPADRLRERDIPARWGEYFDLFDCVGNIRDTWDRDTASFVRRGLTEEPRRVVVFLAGEPPTGSEEPVRRLTELRAAAEVVWVTFAPQAPEVADDFRATGTHFFREHEDVVNEIVQLLMDAKASRRPGSTD